MVDIVTPDGALAVAKHFEHAARRIDSFAQTCGSDPESAKIRLTCSPEGRIDIAFGDASITAAPRLVKFGNNFIPEWTFVAENNFRSTELWRFFLDKNGMIWEEVDANGVGVEGSEHSMCGYPEEYANWIMGKVVARLIDSDLYKPSGPLNTAPAA